MCVPCLCHPAYPEVAGSWPSRSSFSCLHLPSWVAGVCNHIWLLYIQHHPYLLSHSPTPTLPNIFSVHCGSSLTKKSLLELLDVQGFPLTSLWGLLLTQVHVWKLEHKGNTLAHMRETFWQWYHLWRADFASGTVLSALDGATRFFSCFFIRCCELMASSTGHWSEQDLLTDTEGLGRWLSW